MYHRATLIVLFLLTLVVVHSTWSVYQKKVESEEMKNISQKNVDELRARDNDLNSKIQRLDTTPGLEAEIRSKFTVAKNNENMVVIVDDKQSDATTTIAKASFWTKLKAFFGMK